MDKIDATWRDRLEQFLKDEAISMRSASLRAGQSPSYVFKLLQMKQDPSVDILLELAKTLEMNPIWLLFGVALDKDAEDLILKYMKLDPTGRQKVMDMVDNMK